MKMIRNAIASVLLVACIAGPAAAQWNLAEDWSDESVPFGPWELPADVIQLPDIDPAGTCYVGLQPAWGYVPQLPPAYLKATATCEAFDLPVGDIGVIADSWADLYWRAPQDGTVSVNFEVWDAYDAVITTTTWQIGYQICHSCLMCGSVNDSNSSSDSPQTVNFDLEVAAGKIICFQFRSAVGIGVMAGVRISINYQGEGCQSDLNADGLVGFDDVLAVLAAWGDEGSADIDESGVVDFGDLLLVLGQWGPC